MLSFLAVGFPIGLRTRESYQQEQVRTGRLNVFMPGNQLIWAQCASCNTAAWIGIDLLNSLVITWSHLKQYSRADPRFAPSQWETSLLCNDISHWLGASLESALSSMQHRQQSFEFEFEYSIAMKIVKHRSDSGPHFNINSIFSGMGIPIVKIRQSWDCLILISVNPSTSRMALYIETIPWTLKWRPMSFRCLLRVFWRKFTLYVLNFSEGTWTYICILCHFSTLIWRR